MKKGFTLIELLAVIVILAIIALIATPLILGVIDTAKKGAAESGAMGYVKAVETSIIKNMIENQEQLQANIYDISDLIVDYKGKGPTKGNVTISQMKTVTSATLCISDYYVIYDGTKAKVDKTKSCEQIETEYNYTSPSCFEVYNGYIISKYYDHENNDPLAAACPRDVVIPFNMNGQDITQIARWVFADKNITNVKIPKTLKVIEDGAFARNLLTSVTIPSSVTAIGNNAFENNLLTNITIPKNVLLIGDSAFALNQLTSVKIIGKSSSDEFTFYGNNIWGWANAYSDANVEWNAN